MVSLIAGLKMKGIVKWRGLKSQGPLYIYMYVMYLHVDVSVVHVFIYQYLQ